MNTSSNARAMTANKTAFTQNATLKPSTKQKPIRKDNKSHAKMAWDHLKRFSLNKSDEIKYYEPRSWSFWRGIVLYFCIFSVVGHWMEIPYCNIMHSLFGIVEETYDVWTDPFYKPYWVYGVGAAAITILLMPLKFWVMKHSKSMFRAVLLFLAVAIALAAFLECTIGLIINQPDQFGEYPYWNNSVLPLNILGQAWLVNDFFLGLVSLLYVFLVFPFLQKFMDNIGNTASNRVFACGLALFAVICVLSYA